MRTVKKSYHKPIDSIIDKGFNGTIDYLDSFSTVLPPANHDSIDYLTALLFTSFPVWVTVLLKLRNFIVKPFGLKTGLIPGQETIDKSIQYNVGDKAIFFSVVDRSESEIVMSEDDRHLCFRTSVLVERGSEGHPAIVHLTTLVRFHNMWGRVYFVPVKPFHQIIMRTLLSIFSKAKTISSKTAEPRVLHR